MSHTKVRPFRRVSRRPPASGRKPSAKLPAGAVDASAEALLAFHRRFDACFRRREQRQWSLFYLCGQLSNLERKTIEAMVLNLRGADESAGRDLERFLSDGRWDQPGMVQRHQALAAEWLGEPDGVIIADGSGFPKQGAHSVGVVPQYCGHLGKVANCQQGVFLVYASARGHAFLEAQLYLPEEWFTQAYQARWQACRIPAGQPFRTEPQIALDMLTQVVQRARVPFRWVTADETYGKSPVFLDGIEQLGQWFMVEVPTDTRVWLRTPAVEPPGPGLQGRPRRLERSALAPPRRYARHSRLTWRTLKPRCSAAWRCVMRLAFSCCITSARLSSRGLMLSKSLTFSGSFRGRAIALADHESPSHRQRPALAGGDISTLEKGDITTLR